MAAPIFLRGQQGLWTIDGTKYSSEVTAEIDQSKTCKCMTFSDDGSLFAWCNADSLYVMDANTMEILQDLGIPKLVDIKFSPRGSVLAAWNHYMVNREGASGLPNLYMFDAKTGDIKKSYIQKKQVGWCPEWSSDEGVCVRNVNNELQFYENNNFDSVANKLHLQKVSSFSLSRSSPPYTLAAYVPGSKGQPSFVRIYRYPNLSGLQAALATKSFFKADRVNFFWNQKGNSLLVLTSTESSESSYYGEQGLHFLSTSGDSCIVPLQKTGPIYHIEWLPNQTEFILIHGYMPAKSTIYNLKCEPVFDFGTGPRNICSINPQGTILCMAGFGNLAGNLEFWDMKQRKQIAQTKATDTTHFEWCPDGQHLMTSTCAPRLRVGNGFRIWHYSGTLMLQKFIDSHAELWQAKWKPQPPEQAPKFSISTKAVVSDAAVEQPKAKVGAYRPPSQRGLGMPAPAQKPLHDYEPPSNAKESDKAPSKNKKKRDARKAKAAAGDQEETSSVGASAQPAASSNNSVQIESTGDPEKDKKIRNLRKKVQAIEKLKDQQAAGKTMEKNQLEKIKTLDSLLEEIENLELE